MLFAFGAGHGTAADAVVIDRKQVSIANWDKGGALSHWVYTHASEVFPAGLVRRGGALLELKSQPRPEIGRLIVDDEKKTSLDGLVANGAVDGCIVLHAGQIVYEKYANLGPDELHLAFSVSKAFTGTALALLEDAGRLDLRRPVDAYVPELKGSAWEGIPLAEVADMRSGVEGEESSGDAYRNPAHKAFQLEATLGWQLRTAPELPQAARAGDLIGFLATVKRIHPPGEAWAYTSSNTAVLGEVVSRVSGSSLAAAIGELIWSRIGAEHDALLLQNDRGFPVAHAGVALSLRDLARFGLLFTPARTSAPDAAISERVVNRMLARRGGVDEHGMLPQTYQWDMVTAEGELAKGGWAGQLLYVNRQRDVVVAYFGTNLTADPPLEALPSRMIAKIF
jgi:CubicO group peptidase (beta-lactamase class C family)